MRDGQLGLRVSLGLAAVAMVAVAVAENARIPVDNPATHLELTMVHEAMLLEASGRHLALWEAQAALRLTLWLALVAAIFVPFGAAPAGAGPVAWVLGLGSWALKMGALAAGAGGVRERDRQDAGVPRAGIPGRGAADRAAGRGAAVRRARGWRDGGWCPSGRRRTGDRCGGAGFRNSLPRGRGRGSGMGVAVRAETPLAPPPPP
jgi:hypothetical protein